jgi:butyrate kinase
LKTNPDRLFEQIRERAYILKTEGIKKRLTELEKLFWVGEYIVSPMAVDDLRPVLKLPGESTIRSWKYFLQL